MKKSGPQKNTRTNAVIREHDFIDPLVKRIFDTYSDNLAINRNDRRCLPREPEILGILNQILELIFPGFADRESQSSATLQYTVGEIVSSIYPELRDLVSRVLRFTGKTEKGARSRNGQAMDAARHLLESIPELRETLKFDIQAAYAGDPAAKSLDEVVLSYPGIKALTIQRIAHRLYLEKVPLIPRMMCEYAHRITGIDIHPGAKLGKGIFIDHGTGVVIGETAELGDDVKIYQGVTLGALSFPKDACGMIIKGAKRHPTIEDNVTLYAGATVLGAVRIGKGSVIGGNVWLTESTEPYTKITIAAPELTINKTGRGFV